MALQQTDSFYYVINDVIVTHPQYGAGPYPRPSKYGPNDPDSHLASQGHWSLWVDDPGSPGENETKVIGIATPNPANSPPRVERVDTLQIIPDDIRARKEAEILAQVPETIAIEVARTEHMEPELVRYATEANAKILELQETDDADLESFDSKLDMESDRSGTRNSRFSINIRQLPPWVGQPSNIYGWVATLTMELDQAAVGAEARVIVADAPSDVSAVIPMTQDATDPTIWRATARDGHKWSDPTLPASIQLLWGAGSLPTSPVITSKALNDRKSTIVRYAEPV